MKKQLYIGGNPQGTMSSTHDGLGQPRWFGDHESPLFGWLHSPPAVTRNAALVLCPPFGHEYMVAHRAYRKLAAQLAAAGFSVLRFDYHGTGDSAGLASDAQRISSWQESIIHAVNEIRQASGLEQVILFGTRLGALLAASVASKAKTDSLIMLAPVLSGRQYTRELLAFRGMKITETSGYSPAATDEVVGYPLTQETKDDLGKLDLTKLTGQLLKSVLIIPRDDFPSNERRIAEALMTDGTAVEIKPIAGYSNLMKDDALDSQVPETIWAFITEWMKNQYPGTSTYNKINLTANKVTTFLHNGQEISEEVLCVNGNTGILSESKNPAHGKVRPTIIITNTGANHRVGNHRLCVTMARSWTLRGFRVIRFDRPGMGDSVAPIGVRENEIYSSSGLQSLVSLMDYLSERFNYEKFILAGLCSGGYFSYQAAISDKRVVGLLMINPLTYQWKDGDTVLVPHRQIYKSTGFYLRSSAQKETWLRLIRGHINWRGITGAIATRLTQRTIAMWKKFISWCLQHDATLSEVGRNFVSLESRGTDIFMIFDSAEGGIDLMEEHLGKRGRLMHKRKNFRIEFIDQADHTFTPIWAQSYLCDLVGDHWVKRFGR
jgi:pimeloyl-ACP methyl ester carboxylesterase